MKFEKLHLIQDQIPRIAAENLAIDEPLLLTAGFHAFPKGVTPLKFPFSEATPLSASTCQVRTLNQTRRFAPIRKWSKTDYHPVGSCKMGHDELAVVLAVVDTQTRVRGIGGLRVIDASIMPTPISGNTQAPSIMIGEKGAAIMITGTVV